MPDHSRRADLRWVILTAMSVNQHTQASTEGHRAAQVMATLRASLAALVPAQVRRVLARDAGERRILIEADDSYALQTSTGAIKLANRNDGDLVQALRRLRGPTASLVIVVPPERQFVRRLSVPAAAHGTLADVLALDLDRTTPFTRDTVYQAHRVVHQDNATLKVEHTIVKAGLIRPLIEAARAARLPIRAIEAVETRAPGDPINLLPVRLRTRAPATRLLGGLMKAATIALVAFLLAMTAWHTWQLDRSIVTATRERDERAAAVAALRREIDAADRALQDARFARSRRHAEPMAVALLDDLTRRLPDTTHVLTLRLDEQTITLEGLSANATELAALLSRSPFVASAAFVAPVTRDPRRGSERFQIRMTRKPIAGAAP